MSNEWTFATEDIHMSAVPVKDKEQTSTDELAASSFQLIAGDGSELLSNVKIATTWDLIEVTMPNSSEILNSDNTAHFLNDALIGHFGSDGKFDGYYDVDWNSTSLFHEMTCFQDTTVRRFFGIWGYKNGSTFIDPCNNSTWGQHTTYAQAIADENAVRQILGSFLSVDDIIAYYRQPLYTTEIDENNKPIWKFQSYRTVTEEEAENLKKNLTHNSIAQTMYEEVRLWETLPLETYNQGKGATTAIMSKGDIKHLFTRDGVGNNDWDDTTEGSTTLDNL